jgi:hypothetical protein
VFFIIIKFNHHPTHFILQKNLNHLLNTNLKYINTPEREHPWSYIRNTIYIRSGRQRRGRGSGEEEAEAEGDA